MGYDRLRALDPFVKVMIYAFFVQVISKAISYLMISDLMDKWSNTFASLAKNPNE